MSLLPAPLGGGAGEGADAIWLAEQGWRVTAVDVSVVALERAAAHAGERGPEVADRIDWLDRDVREWTPPSDRYDLVSAQYFHVPTGVRQSLFEHLARAVAPGGTLLLVGHDLSDREVAPRPAEPERYFTGDEVVAMLDPTAWAVVTNEVRERAPSGTGGHTVTVHDVVVRLHRQEVTTGR